MTRVLVVITMLFSFQSFAAPPTPPAKSPMVVAVTDLSNKIIGLTTLVDSQIAEHNRVEVDLEDLKARHEVLGGVVGRITKLKQTSVNLAPLREKIRDLTRHSDDNIAAVVQIRDVLVKVTADLKMALDALDRINSGEVSDALASALARLVDDKVGSALEAVNARLSALESKVKNLERRIVRWRPGVVLVGSTPTPLMAEFLQVSISVDLPIDAYFVFSAGLGYAGKYENKHTMGITGATALVWRLGENFGLGPAFRYVAPHAFEHMNGDDFPTTYQSFNGGVSAEWVFSLGANTSSSVLGVEILGGGSALLGDKKWKWAFTPAISYAYQF